MDCLFCRMIQKHIPIHPVYEDEQLIVIRDIQPQAPTHLLIIPKEHIATINALHITHQKLLGQMILTAQSMAQQENIDTAGYRLVFNVNKDGGQAIYHIHLHLLGGRTLHWPPG